MLETDRKPISTNIAALLNDLANEMKKNNMAVDEIPPRLNRLIKEDGAVQTNGQAELKKDTVLTAGESSSLWALYEANSLAIRVYQYFLNIVKDKEIESILENARQIAQQILDETTALFQRVGYLVPVGFTEEDVNVNAPRLFSDAFLLHYTKVMLIHGLSNYAICISSCENREIRGHFMKISRQTSDLLDRTIELSKSRGEFSFGPMIPSLKKVEYTQKKNFWADMTIDTEPLNAAEVDKLFSNLKKAYMAKTVILAFKQVACSEDVRKFLSSVEKAVYENIVAFRSKLEDDNLPTPKLWDDAITDSTVPPFSDKLMTLHAGFLIRAALVYYGAALATTLRPDLAIAYNKAIKNVIEIGDKWFSLVVKKEWLEKQPHSINRDRLSKEK